MAVILPIAKCHIRQVALLHLRCLTASIKGLSGLHLLLAYYEAVTSERGATGYVAQEGDYVQGYICGVWDPVAFRYMLLRKFWLSLACWGAVQIASDPWDAIPRIGNFLRRVNRDEEGGYELRPIVVGSENRGTGLAARLVERLVQDAIFRGYQWIYLYTEMDNIAAQKFYCKVGFHIERVAHYSGRPYLLYKRRIAEPQWTPISLLNGLGAKDITS